MSIQNDSGSAGGPPAYIYAGGPPALLKKHFFDKAWNYRGYLPHYNRGDVYQMITYRLADALPQAALQKIINEKLKINQKRLRIEKYLDQGYGSCILKNPEVAQIVLENWQWFDEQRYQLKAYVIMPNHVHLLIRVFEGQSLSRIIQGWKSYTAKKINQYLLKKSDLNAGGPGFIAGGPPALPVWQRDYWDRYIRDEKHYFFVLNYIHNNPVQAGICKLPQEWKWSSALYYEGLRDF